MKYQYYNIMDIILYLKMDIKQIYNY